MVVVVVVVVMPPSPSRGTGCAFRTNALPLTAVPSRENGLNPAADPSPGSLCTLIKEGHGGCLQVKKSLGLEIADLRCRVRHEEGIFGFEDRSHALRKARVSLARLSNLGPSWHLPTHMSVHP